MSNNYSYIADAISIEADELLKKDRRFETRLNALYSVTLEVDMLVGKLMESELKQGGGDINE